MPKVVYCLKRKKNTQELHLFEAELNLDKNSCKPNQ